MTPLVSLVCNGIFANDASGLRQVGGQLNQEIVASVEHFPNAVFVDIAGGFEPHDLCSGGEEWLNPYVTLFDPTGTSKFPPGSCPAPLVPSTICRSSRTFHPNDLGYRYSASAVTSRILGLDWTHLYRPPAPTPAPPATSANGCATDKQVLTATRDADPSLADFARVSDKFCEGGYVAAWIDQSASGLGVLLRRDAGALTAVVVRENPCADAAVQAGNAAIRQFFGC
jgi:hypothetical protein